MGQIDLKDFFIHNVTKNDYHYKFYDFIKNINNTYNPIADEMEKTDNYEFYVYDSEEAITHFKELCMPRSNNNFSKEETCWFYLITFYLHSIGYEIKEFPRVLARPPVDLSDFAYEEIRKRLISLNKHCNGTVRFAARRKFVSEFTFEIKTTHIKINDTIKEKFIEISTRQASFESMSTDEKLAEIINLIENMLKKDGKYAELDYKIVCCEFITNDQIKKYKNAMQCFRHCTDESILERKKYTEKQKDFLIDYGLTIVKAIHALLH